MPVYIRCFLLKFLVVALVLFALYTAVMISPFVAACVMGLDLTCMALKFWLSLGSYLKLAGYSPLSALRTPWGGIVGGRGE